MQIGKYTWEMNRPYIMGILNVTPDSFWDGGLYSQADAAVKRGLMMQAEGADIIDVGGESTRPGFIPVSEEEEMDRIMPVIERLIAELDIPVSLDTSKPNVAREGLKLGVGMINDIWGGVAVPEDASTIADTVMWQYPDRAIILMHNRRENHQYEQMLQEICNELRTAAIRAESNGVAHGQIVLDPGVGFAKNYEQNIQVIKNLKFFNNLGYPILLGTSRKSVIGQTLGLPENDRLEGTLVTSVYGMMKGCNILRVHDVKEHVRAMKMLEAILDA